MTQIRLSLIITILAVVAVFADNLAFAVTIFGIAFLNFIIAAHYLRRM